MKRGSFQNLTSMSNHVVRVRAPSRLHFGMLSFGDSTVRQFGGVGVMTEMPHIELLISPSRQLEIFGVYAQRLREFVHRWVRFRRFDRVPACRLELVTAPRQHSGLGTGTQLALSVAAGLNAFFDCPRATPQELAASVGRGRRSAVGTYGFVHGGLIAEQGKRCEEPLAVLAQRIALPSSWRFVLLIPVDQVGLSGHAEQEAFATLPRVPRSVTEQLIHEMKDRLLPSAAEGCLEGFGQSVYRYGVTAGKCFAPRQSGTFASQRLADWVELIRDMGVSGVGQSSWGPTLFALLASQSQAETFVADLSSRIDAEDLQFAITPIDNSGARCVTEPKPHASCENAPYEL